MVGSLLVLFLILVALGFMRLPLMNIDREVTQHSQQYIETKRSLLLSLIADAKSAQSPEHEIAITNRFCEEYEYVDFDVPNTIHIYAAANCR